MRRALTHMMAALAVSLVLIGVTLSLAAAQSFPVKTGRVVDDAGIINADTRTVLTHTLDRLAARTADEIVVVTVKSIGGQDIDSYATALGRFWQLGEPGKNNGALVLVADDVGKVAIQVGDGLRATLPDSTIVAILNNRILPELRAKNMPGGLISGVDSLSIILTAAFEDRTRGQPVPPVIVPKTFNDRMFGYFLLGMMGLFGSTFVIIVATMFGWLPEKRTGVWRILDAIVWLGSSIRVRTSSDSSSSGSSGRFSGGGGTAGGGGSSGNW
jgi:uncharacterized protein